MDRPDFAYFDLGNVLLYFDHGMAIRRMAQLAGVPAETMRQAIFDTNLQIEYETGFISGDDFIQRIGQHIGKPLDTQVMLAAAADMFIPNHLMVPILEHVRSIGVPIGLLSNTCEAHWNWIVEQRYAPVHDWFEHVVLSYEVKSMKPDRGIYEVATKLAGCDPSKIFFTDDRHDNVEGAIAHGWTAVPFTSADRLMEIVRHW